MKQQHTENGLTVLDRSALELWANCPAAAMFKQQGAADCAGLDASSGNEVHTAISKTISEYIASCGSMETSDIHQFLCDALAASRPDVQPDAIDAVMPFKYAFAAFLRSLQPEFIYAYDGGAGDHTSQLAWDFTELGCRVTSELDFLYSSASPAVFKLIDWKSGHKSYSEEGVKDSFQFGMHAWLIFSHWNEAERVDVSVWETRHNRKTAPVSFHRRDMETLGARAHSAAKLWKQYNAEESAPAWPAPEKCRLCDSIMACTSASREVFDIQSDTHAMVVQAILYEQAVEKIKENLKPITEATGRDIVTPNGFSFGSQREKLKRKPTMEFYVKKGSEEE